MQPHPGAFILQLHPPLHGQKCQRIQCLQGPNYFRRLQHRKNLNMPIFLLFSRFIKKYSQEMSRQILTPQTNIFTYNFFSIDKIIENGERYLKRRLLYHFGDFAHQDNATTIPHLGLKSATRILPSLVKNWKLKVLSKVVGISLVSSHKKVISKLPIFSSAYLIRT